MENADDQTLEEDVVGLDRLTAKQGTVTEAQFKEPRRPLSLKGQMTTTGTTTTTSTTRTLTRLGSSLGRLLCDFRGFMCAFDAALQQPDYQP